MSFTHLKHTLDLVSSIAVTGAAAALVWTLYVRSPSAPASSSKIEEVTGLRIDATKIRHVAGRGRIVIVEFSDFQCPFCARHAKETLPSIKRDFVDSGKVRYVALNFPLEGIHPLARAASEAAECAGKQDRFWEMHERLFANAKELTTTSIVQNAQDLQLADLRQFVECLERHETADIIRTDLAEGRRLGVTGTPVFFVGRMRPDGGIDLVKRIIGAAPLEVFSDQIGELSASASPP